MPQAHPADVSRIDWLRNELSQMADDIERMRAAESWQAATNTRAQMLRVRDKLDEIQAAEQNKAAVPTSLDDLFSMLERLPRNTWEHPRAQRLLLKAV